ncbi:potassium-transporting ATPase subunit KdpA [Campylobacter estrildidarum]|uniref:Potassium-transporting ATPase potassium-binding subunit n=1 Tax=Campylobacter estrildidarum TaxID=2510189 RepID=A0A4U7BK23_9BACT|nr:potassium-transporting ATPase subunit KdpA [Campylobacter estrildidarum]TKX31959.1 potassium-transporting ATPase subunit A [Campylobacter estrildidarum]
MLEIVVILLISFILSLIFGRYLYKITNFKKTIFDFIFNPIDDLIYKICTVDRKNMTWKQYSLHLCIFNFLAAIFSFVIFLLQDRIFLNPNSIKSMPLDLSLNTAISFITNTNLQHYSGENALSLFSQSTGILLTMFVSGVSGCCACMAFCRAFCGMQMGNYYEDFTRIMTRLVLPLSFIISLIFISQGVVQNYDSNFHLITLENKIQAVATGPVAAIESIKHLGTNGGGFFGANSSMPFENPNALTNLIQILSMMLIPSSCVVAFGLMIHHRKENQGFVLMGKQGGVIFGAMSLIFLISLIIIYHAETMPNPNLSSLDLNQTSGNLEGKELRFGTNLSSLFSAVTTAFTTGSVNNMHDSLNPLSIGATMLNMMLNVAFGGDGVGLMNMMIYVILCVFICALMIGRTPEFLGKKIESKQMKLIALAILIHPLLILVLSALGVIFAKDSISNPSFHGLAQILYEFTSATANNGSGLEGLKDNNLFWNLSTAFAMFCGRYLILIIQLAIAGSFLSQKTQENNTNTLKTDTLTFMFVLICIVYIFAALTFFPVLTLSSVAEYLSLWH